MHLNSTVAVGFVIGVIEKISPMGSANFLEAAFGKLADDADRSFVPDVVVNEFQGDHVLDRLVLEDAQPGLLDRQTGQVLRLAQPRQHHCLHDPIYVFLTVLGEDGGGGPAALDQFLR